MNNCWFSVNNAAINFVLITMVFVLHETIIFLSFFHLLIRGTNNFFVMKINQKSLSNLG